MQSTESLKKKCRDTPYDVSRASLDCLFAVGSSLSFIAGAIVSREINRCRSSADGSAHAYQPRRVPSDSLGEVHVLQRDKSRAASGRFDTCAGLAWSRLFRG